MRLFTFIIAIYMLGLSVVPCSDVHNDCNNTNTELSQNHNHNKDQNDNCTPFCTCACCNASVVAYYLIPTQYNAPMEFSIAQKISIRNFSFTSNFFGNIWQPPKNINC